jgi:AcrR family transcriptional regulator
VPRISAPTLAEHQAYQRHALVAAAVEILAEEGVAALTPAAVGRRASLARSSTYQYFDSSAALLATAVEEAQAEVDAVVARATDGADGPGATVDAWVTCVLGLATTSAARALRALERAELPPMCAARLGELAAAQRAPLVRALAGARVAEPWLTALLVAAVVDAGASEVASGTDPGLVQARVLALVHAGIDRA